MSSDDQLDLNPCRPPMASRTRPPLPNPRDRRVRAGHRPHRWRYVQSTAESVLQLSVPGLLRPGAGADDAHRRLPGRRHRLAHLVDRAGRSGAGTRADEPAKCRAERARHSSSQRLGVPGHTTPPRVRTEEKNINTTNQITLTAQEKQAQLALNQLQQLVGLADSDLSNV